MLTCRSVKLILYLFYCFWLISEITAQKSEAKCKEHAKYVYTEEESLVRRSKDKVSQCGIVEVPLVIGGIEAAPKEFPHTALIGYKPNSEIEWKCGGSLISENFVLSAAHCHKYQGAAASTIRLGEVNLESESESETQDFNIIQIIQHPDYTSSKYNDIILFKLDHSATFNAYVRPACLHYGKSIKETKAIASGFGKTSFDASEGSKKLMKVNLNIIPNADCETYFKREKQTGQLKNGINDLMLCAGELKGGKDTCQGDSGGPLQVVLAEPYCMYSIIGIVSFGKFCGFANQPAIYTKVSSYIPWIEKNVWP